MSKFSSRLKLLRTQAKLSQQELADALKISKSSVNMYERGEREPGLETIEAIADHFNVDLNYLLGKSDISNKTKLFNMALFDNIHPISTKRIPMLGEIACGKPIYADEDRESYVLAGTDIKADFCLKTKGDSMINAHILDGSIVFCRSQSTVDNGEIAVVIIEDEATLKRVSFFPDKNLLILKAENPAYPDLIYQGEELNQIHILGKAIACQIDVK